MSSRDIVPSSSPSSCGSRFLSKLVMLTCKSGASFSALSRLSESSCNVARSASVFCWVRSPTCRKGRIRINSLPAPRNSARVLGSKFSLCPSVSRAFSRRARLRWPWPCVAAAAVFGAVEFGGRREKLNTECCVRWKESVSSCSESEVPVDDLLESRDLVGVAEETGLAGNRIHADLLR